MTVQLREGVEYRDANGDKQGPLRDFGEGTEDNYGWSPPDEKWVWWNSEGKAEPGCDCVDLIAEWTDGPVRTVTRTVTEIVPGEYDQVRVGETDPEGFVMIAVGHSEPLSPWSSTELKAAAAVLLELAGALEE